MRVTPQAASQPADGSPPRYGSAIAPEGTAFHSTLLRCLSVCVTDSVRVLRVRARGFGSGPSGVREKASCEQRFMPGQADRQDRPSPDSTARCERERAARGHEGRTSL